MLSAQGGAAVTGGPFNVQAGFATQITPPGQSQQQAYAFVIIYNQTSSILTVQGVGGSFFLQPLQADIYSMPIGTGFFNSPSVTPTTAFAAGTYLGTITATFLPANSIANREEQVPPPGFPLPLVSFPGGSSLLLAPTDFGGFSAISGVSAGAPLTFSPPNGTGVLVFNGIGIQGGGTLTLKGVQTGTTYYTQSASTTGGPVSIPIVGSIDTSYIVSVTSGSAFWNTIFAFPGIIPTFATMYGTAQISGTSIGPAGIMYVFGIDIQNASAAAAGFNYVDANNNLVARANVLANDNIEIAGTFRCLGPIVFNTGGAANTTFTVIRYNTGP